MTTRTKNEERLGVLLMQHNRLALQRIRSTNTLELDLLLRTNRRQRIELREKEKA